MIKQNKKEKQELFFLLFIFRSERTVHLLVCTFLFLFLFVFFSIHLTKTCVGSSSTLVLYTSFRRKKFKCVCFFSLRCFLNILCIQRMRWWWIWRKRRPVWVWILEQILVVISFFVNHRCVWCYMKSRRLWLISRLFFFFFCRIKYTDIEK